MANMFESYEYDANDEYDIRHRANSTINPLPFDYVNVKSTSPKPNHSPNPSLASSTSSLTTTNNSKASFLKVSLSNRKSNSSSPTDDQFVMTIIRSPSAGSQRIHSTDSVETTNANNNVFPNNNFLKSKMTAALNHMKYRWVAKMRPNFRTNATPIYLLGKLYNGKEDTSFDDTPRLPSEQCYSNFLEAFSQRIYFSYRKQFEPLIGSRSGEPMTSDGGWGCMIRCAQMLLAQTLLIHMTNTVNPHYVNIQMSEKCPKRNSIEYSRHLSRMNRVKNINTEIIRLFGDYPNAKCPFGIHKIVEIGASHGIRPGDFFGPVSAAHCLKEAVQLAIEANQFAEAIRIYIAQDAIIYRQDVNDLCNDKNSDTNKKSSIHSKLSDENTTRWSKSVLILVPLRLGLNELDLIYEDYLKNALELPHTVGIIGGSPRHAVYIVGYQEDSFIVLDPHFIQSAVNVLENKFDTSTYSCSSPKRLSAKRMDPSCTLGFYCRDKADFEMFCAQWNRVCHLATEDRRSCPIFRIERTSFQENHTRTLNFDYPSLNEDEDIYLRVTKLSSNSNFSFSSNKKFTNTTACRDSWDDTGLLINENNIDQSHAISDDYVFL